MYFKMILTKRSPLQIQKQEGAASKHNRHNAAKGRPYGGNRNYYLRKAIKKGDTVEEMAQEQRCWYLACTAHP